MLRYLFTTARPMMLVALALVTSAASCGNTGPGAAEPCPYAQSEQQAQAAVFMNIISGKSEPHSVVMALDLATQAIDQGREVVVFFNVDGAAVPTVTLPENWGVQDKSVRTMLNKLIRRGALVMVCPHCMSYLGVPANQLLPGVTMATTELVFSRLGPDTVVLTY